MSRRTYRKVAFGVLGAAVVSAACAQILGGDDYSVGPKGAGGGGGTPFAADAPDGFSGSGSGSSGGLPMDGRVFECRVASDCQPVEACRTARCEDGHCMTDLKPAGSDCADNGGKRCDDLGECVACRVDGVLNDSETDTDCGGSDCPPCADLLACETNSDCASNVCKNGLCFPATCIDGQHNGDEADVDCGGSCPGACAQGKTCTAPTDCVTGFCSDGVCCGSDCGRCRICMPGTGACELMAADTDPDDEECPGVANLCDGNGRCTYCADATLNGAESEETDLDCGGSVCDPCPVGGACLLDRDCATCACDTGACVAPRCDNGQKDGCETDVDCGGPCPPCVIGQSCLVKADCTLFNCVEGVCVQ